MHELFGANKRSGFNYHPHIVLILLLVATMLLSACGRKPQSQAAPVPEVVTMTVQSEKQLLTTELPGRTSSYLVAEIRPQVNGIIQKRLFNEGSDVQAGEVLYRIDPAPFQAALDNAKASLGKSQANLPAIKSKAERYRALLAEKVVSQQDYDDRDAALKQAEADIAYWKAALETAQINLGYTQVTAPISGRIGKSSVTDGALVTAYQSIPLATIQQLDPIYVDVPQATTELLRLKRRLGDGRLNQDGTEHNKVKVILEDSTSYPHEGTLQFRDVTVDPTTGSVVLRIVVPNPDGLLLPGMFVRAQIREGVNENAILIPHQAVARDPKGNPYALIVDSDAKIQQKMLRIDRSISDKWMISKGLKPGDNIVLEGMQKARPGTVVKATPIEEPSKTVSQNSSQPAEKTN